MKIMKLVLVFSLLMCSSNALCQPTCCLRTVAVLPIDSTGLSSPFESPIHHDCATSDCHPYSIMSLEGMDELRKIVDEIGKLYGADLDPEAQKIVSQLLDLDYLFRGELVALEGAEGPTSYTLNIEFFDHHRGQIVKDGRTSWTGSASDGNDAVRALATTFLPLDELMLDYERIPETATLRPARDPIEAGDTMTVNISNLVDAKKRSSQPWQWILAKANIGKILNGTPQAEGFRRFEVGDGSIDLRYRAPDECKKQTEMIAIYNTCNNDSKTVVNLIPENTIAVTTFEIHCEPKPIWTGTVTYTRSYIKIEKQQGPNNSTVKTNEIVSEKADFEIHGWPFSHSYEGSVGTDLYYEGDEGSLTGSYSGTYKKITTIQSSEGQGTITDTAFCQATIRDSGYLVINNEELRSYLELGLSFVDEDPCRGQTVYSGLRGSHTMDFDWDQLETFAGMGFLESSIPGRNPQTVSGSYSLPEWSITWTWNISFSGR